MRMLLLRGNETKKPHIVFCHAGKSIQTAVIVGYTFWLILDWRQLQNQQNSTTSWLKIVSVEWTEDSSYDGKWSG